MDDRLKLCWAICNGRGNSGLHLLLFHKHDILRFSLPVPRLLLRRIFASDLSNFEFSPSSFYMNKEVRITGTIQLYNGAPEIVVHSPSQIEVGYMGFSYP